MLGLTAEPMPATVERTSRDQDISVPQLLTDAGGEIAAGALVIERMRFWTAKVWAIIEPELSHSRPYLERVRQSGVPVIDTREVAANVVDRHPVVIV